MKEKKQRRKHEAEKRNTHLLPILLLTAIAVAAYWNSFDVPLVFDDMMSIQRNAGVRFGEYLDGSSFGLRSILYLTFAANYYLHAQDVWGYHLVNFSLHLINGILVFFIAARILSTAIPDEKTSRIYSIFAAAFFLVHPIQTESVTYISSRSELVSVLFYAIAVLIFVRLPEHKIGFSLSLVILGLYLLALGGKETAITLPAVILLYDYLFLSHGSFRPILKRWRFYAVFLAMSLLAIIYVVFRLEGSIGALPGHLGYLEYSLTQTQVIVQYIQLLFIPYGQTLDHDPRVPATVLDAGVIAASLFLIGVILLGWYLRKRQPIAAFSILWFFITLSPTSTFVPILDAMFEHRLYMPMVGLCLVFPILIERLTRVVNTRFTMPFSVERAFAAVILVLITLTVMRNQIWRDERRLWEEAVAKSPHKARPYNALSMVHFKRGEYEKGVEVNERALKVNPQFASAFQETLGNMYLKLGRNDKAIEYFTKIAESSSDAMAYNNLGVAYQYLWGELRQKRQSVTEDEFSRRKADILNNASRAFRKALEIDSDLLWALHAYAYVQFELDGGEQMRAKAEEKLRDKEDFESLYLAGMVHFLKNQYSEAVRYFERAAPLVREIESTKVFFYQYGYSLNQIGEMDRALQVYKTAVRIDPIFLEVYHNMALVYVRKNDLENAVAYFNEALRVDANHVRSHIEIAKVYMRQGRNPQAKEHLLKVLNSDPRQQEALKMWQEIGS